MIKFIKQRLNNPVAWRCHIGVDFENETVYKTWQFLKPYINLGDHIIFSLPEYLPKYVVSEHMKQGKQKPQPQHNRRWYLYDQNKEKKKTGPYVRMICATISQISVLRRAIRGFAILVAFIETQLPLVLSIIRTVMMLNKFANHNFGGYDKRKRSEDFQASAPKRRKISSTRYKPRYSSYHDRYT
eukprot:503062_1